MIEQTWPMLDNMEELQAKPQVKWLGPKKFEWSRNCVIGSRVHDYLRVTGACHWIREKRNGPTTYRATQNSRTGENLQGSSFLPFL